MHDLWLKFLTEIDEKTDDADPDLLSNKDTSEALEIVRRSAFTDSELLAYNLYWLNVSTEKSSLERERMEGREEGEKLGIEKGEKQKAVAIARAMKKHGDDIDYIAMVTELSPEEIKIL